MSDIKYRLIIEGDQVSIKSVKAVDQAVDDLDASVKQTNADLAVFEDRLDESAGSAKKLDTNVDKLEKGVEDLDADVRKTSKSASTMSDRFQSLGARALVLQAGLGRVSEKSVTVGRTLAISVTAPLLAAGAASIKVAADFERSMTQIQTLVGLSAQQVAEFRGQVLTLSGQTARAPQELADALFVITSAGLRGAEALEVLDASAKASAIGLGETADIGRALTAVLQAYAGTGLTAAQATDQLVAVVREGNLEASSLAPALGRVIGIAANMGVSFAEVGANVATFTRLGVSAEQAITGISGVLRSALKPATEQGKEALESMGLSATFLRDQIEEKGLAGGLVALMQAFKGNTDALTYVIPEIEALSSVLGVAGAQANEYLRIEKSIIHANGLLEEGFSTVADTADFKMKRALTNLKTSAIQLGATLVPVLDSISSAVQTASNWFASLDERQMDSLITLGKIAVVAGPAIFALGKIGVAVSALGLKVGIASGGLTLLIGALAAVTTALYLQEGGFDAFKNFASASVDAVKSYFSSLPRNLFATANMIWNVIKAPFDFLAILVNDITTQIVKTFANIPQALLLAVQGKFDEAFAVMTSDFKGFGELIDDTWAETLERLSTQTVEFSDQFKEDAERVATTAVALGAKIKDAFTFDLTGANQEQLTNAALQTAQSLDTIADHYTTFGEKVDERLKASNKSFMQSISSRTQAKESEAHAFTRSELMIAEATLATHSIMQSTTEEYVQANIDRRQSAGEAVKGIASAALREMKIYLALTIATAIKKSFTSSMNPLTGAIMGAISAAAVTALFSQIPGFEKGGLVEGGRQVVEINESGQEFVVNAESTKHALPLLELINENPRQARQIIQHYNEIGTSEIAYNSQGLIENEAEISPQTSANSRGVQRVDSKTEDASAAVFRERHKIEMKEVKSLIRKMIETPKFVHPVLISKYNKQKKERDADFYQAEMSTGYQAEMSRGYQAVSAPRASFAPTQSTAPRIASEQSASMSTAGLFTTPMTTPVEPRRSVSTRTPRDEQDRPAVVYARRDLDVRAPEKQKDYVMVQDEPDEELDIFERIRRAFFDDETQSVSSSIDAFNATIIGYEDEIESARARMDSRMIDRYTDRSNENAQMNAESQMKVIVEVTGKIDNEVIRLANERAVTVQRSFS